MWRELGVFYMKTFVHLGLHLAELMLEWEMFETEIVEKIKTSFL